MTEALVDWLRTWGELSLSSALLLVCVFIVSGFIYLPRILLCLAVGAIFGPIAIPIILPSVTIGAVFAFLIARHLIAAHVQRWIDGRPQVRAIADTFDSEGWRLVALMRLGGPLPSIAQNYLFGVSRIRLWPYTIATFVFCSPLISLYISIGAAGRMTLDDSSSVYSRPLAGLGALCLVVVTLLIWRRAMVAVRLCHHGNTA